MGHVADMESGHLGGFGRCSVGKSTDSKKRERREKGGPPLG